MVEFDPRSSATGPDSDDDAGPAGDAVSWASQSHVITREPGNAFRRELELAECAVELDQDERAEAALRAAAELAENDIDRVGLWVVRGRLALRQGGVIPVPPSAELLERLHSEGFVEVAGRAWVLVAASARMEGNAPGAAEALDRACGATPAGSEVNALVATERARLLQSGNRADEAAELFREAMRGFQGLESRGLLGRAMIEMAGLVAQGAQDPDPPAVWLARAHTTLGELATWRDRAQLRSAFRRHGRRLPDRVLSDAIVDRVAEIDRTSSRLESMLLSLSDGLDRTAPRGPGSETEFVHVTISTLLPSATDCLNDMRRASTEMSELAAAVAAERNQFRGLLLTLADAGRASTVAELSARAVKIARSALDADSCLLVQATESGYEELARSSEGEMPQEMWLSAVEDCLRVHSSRPPTQAGAALRREVALLGSELAVPVRSAKFRGAVYLDKHARRGRFDENAYQLASVLATYLGQTLGMLLARESEGHAMAEAQAAFKAIRDGVLSVDADGVVRATNATAVRMLNQGEMCWGRRLTDFPAMEPLAALLVPPRPVDGAVIRLRAGKFVVTAQPVEVPGSSRRGAVATLVEHDRARRAALRFVNARPRFTFDDIVGSSRQMMDAIALARHAATLDANVLITGESGTGKEVFAQAIHTGGNRVDEPFVGINCAALPRELLESELFGYEGGAFTGGRAEGAMGKFELAGEGTLFARRNRRHAARHAGQVAPGDSGARGGADWRGGGASGECTSGEYDPQASGRRGGKGAFQAGSAISAAGASPPSPAASGEAGGH